MDNFNLMVLRMQSYYKRYYWCKIKKSVCFHTDFLLIFGVLGAISNSFQLFRFRRSV